ncbi:hypothetical protein V498_09282, partial [Pseudogymnoascus sp. VKM F-4517 (FW-2822)]
MMAPQADQHPDSPSFPVDDPLHWPVNLDPYLRTSSHLETQPEWAAQMQAKTFTSMQNQSLNQNHNQGNQNQPQYSSYQEAHSQTTYPTAAPQLLTSDLPYATPSASFATTTHWAPSPGADSGDSTVLSPQSERDFRHDMSPYGGGLPLERSQSGISALSHLSHESAELWPASAAGGGNGQPQFHPQTTGSLAMINPELGEEEAPVFGGEVLSFRDEDMFMDGERGEMEGGGLHTLAPRPPANSQFLHPHSPAPSHHHRHHHHTSPSPAPSAYSAHSTHKNNQAPHLTPHHNHYVEEDTDMDNDVDIDSPLPIPDDNDTDDSYSPTTRRPTRGTRASKKRTTTTRRPPSVLHPASNARVTKQRLSNPSSTSGGRNGRSNGATPTFPCTFAWAGCPSAFATKNEWKRHVASKHTCFFYYECRIGSCSAPGQAGRFNRKDLFAQHLRRMHAPSASSLAKGGPAAKEEWDEKLKGYLLGG